MRTSPSPHSVGQQKQAKLISIVKDLSNASPEVLLNEVVNSGFNYDEDTAELMALYGLDPNDKDVQAAIASTIVEGLYEYKINKNPFVSHAPPQSAFGPVDTADVVIGRLLDRDAYWGYRYDGDVEHCLIGGCSGSAKTSLMLFLAIQLLLVSEGNNPQADALVKELMKSWEGNP